MAITEREIAPGVFLIYEGVHPGLVGAVFTAPDGTWEVWTSRSSYDAAPTKDAAIAMLQDLRKVEEGQDGKE